MKIRAAKTDRAEILQEQQTHEISGLRRIWGKLLLKNGKSGILKSVRSRTEFLPDESRLIRFIDLLKHSSWLNQIEFVFGIFERRGLHRGNFKLLADGEHRP